MINFYLYVVKKSPPTTTIENPEIKCSLNAK